MSSQLLGGFSHWAQIPLEGKIWCNDGSIWFIVLNFFAIFNSFAFTQKSAIWKFIWHLMCLMLNSKLNLKHHQIIFLRSTRHPRKFWNHLSKKKKKLTHCSLQTRNYLLIKIKWLFNEKLLNKRSQTTIRLNELHKRSFLCASVCVCACVCCQERRNSRKRSDTFCWLWLSRSKGQQK